MSLGMAVFACTPANSENEKTLKLIKNIKQYSGVLLKIVRKFGGIPI